jgi:hypothetical protein
MQGVHPECRASTVMGSMDHPLLDTPMSEKRNAEDVVSTIYDKHASKCF